MRHCTAAAVLCRRFLPAEQNIVNFGKRVAMNTPIQGTAADIIKIAMIRVYRRLKKEQLDARLILQVHDELIVEAPQHEVEQVKVLLQEEMQAAAKLKVLLKADVGTGKTWYSAKWSGLRLDAVLRLALVQSCNFVTRCLLVRAKAEVLVGHIFPDLPAGKKILRNCKKLFFQRGNLL